jgi:hypothetical protein
MPQGYRDVIRLLLHGTYIYAEVFPYADVNSGTPLHGLAKWDGTSSSILAAASFNPLSGLAFAQGTLYAAGSLYVPGAQVPLTLGQLIQTNWVPVGGGVGDGLSVFGIASDDTNLFVIGSFRTVDSIPADGFAIWDGTHWIAPLAESRGGLAVEALTENGGEILASEVGYTNSLSGRRLVEQYLVQYRGTNRTVLARGDAGGMSLMKRSPDGVYCTGDFRAVGGVPTGNLTLWNGTNWTKVGRGNFQGLSAQATCLAVAGTNVYAAGDFQYAGEVAANHIARWDGASWHPLGTGIDGTVVKMATRGDDLFVVGTFTSTGGRPATNVAKWNGATWSDLGAGWSGLPTAITATEQYVFVARTIDSSGFVISRWDGAVWSDVASGTFGYGRIYTMLALDDGIVVGGSFGSINGEEVNNVARWDGGQWRSLGSGLSGGKEWFPNEFNFTIVRALLSDGTNLYAGGSFTNAGGVPAMNVARWDGSQWSALGTGIPGYGSCLFGRCINPVTSLALLQGKLFAGGGFTSGFSAPGPRGFLARWDGTAWTDVVEGAWTIDMGQPYTGFPDELHVWALVSHDRDLYVAGNFGTIAELPSYGLAIWHEGNPPAIRPGLKGDKLVLSWPRQFQFATIEFSESLASLLWRPVPSLTWEISESATNDVEVAITPAGSERFYRLGGITRTSAREP